MPATATSGPQPGPPFGPPIRLAYVLSHPIQYQSPLLRRIAAEPGIDLTVLYTSDFSVRGYRDTGFGIQMTWDVPLLDGYRYKYLPRLRDADDIYLFKPLNYGYVDEFRSGKYDAVWVHGYATATNIMAMLAAKLIGRPVIQRVESTLIDRERTGLKLRAKAAVLRQLHYLVDAVLPIGTLNAAYWRHYLPDTPQFLMPYAVDNNYFAARTAAAAPDREAFRLELGLQKGRPVILFASKLVERKRCADLIAAFATLHAWAASAGEPAPYLLIAGDGELRAQLEAQAATLVPTIEKDAIKFLGFQNQTELPKLFSLCDVFCLPSVHEPWGLIVNEAMASGRAVVVSDEVGCCPDLVEDGVTGFVHRARDIASLANALRRATANAAFTTQVGIAAQQRLKHWSYDEDLRGLCAALEHVTGRKVGQPVSVKPAIGKQSRQGPR